MDRIRMELTNAKRETLKRLTREGEKQEKIAERNVLENLGEQASFLLVTDLIDTLFDIQRRLDNLRKLQA